MRSGAARPRAGPRPPRAPSPRAPRAPAPGRGSTVPFGDTYFATVSTRPPSGSGHRLRTPRAAEGVLAHELRPAGVERAPPPRSRPGPRCRCPRAPRAARSRRSAPRRPAAARSSVRRPTSFATGPPFRKTSATFDSVGGRAPRRVAQVEHEARRAAPLERLHLGPHVLRGRGREIGDLDVAGPALEHSTLRRGGRDPLAHDRHVERVGARAEDAELHRASRGLRAGAARPTTAGIGRVWRSSIDLRMSPVRRPAFSAGEPGRGATTITNAKRRVSTRPTSASASFGGLLVEAELLGVEVGAVAVERVAPSRGGPPPSRGRG